MSERKTKEKKKSPVAKKFSRLEILFIRVVLVVVVEAMNDGSPFTDTRRK